MNLRSITLLSCLLATIASPNLLRSQTFTWLNTLGTNTTGQNRIDDIGRDAFGNIYVVGQFRNTVYIGADTFANVNNVNSGNRILIKYDPQGVVQWARIFQVNLVSFPARLATDQLGAVYVMTAFRSNVVIRNNTTSSTMMIGIPGNTLNTNPTPLIVKFDANGSVMNYQVGSGFGPASADAIATDDLDNLYANFRAGPPSNFYGFASQGWSAIKASPTGSLLWGIDIWINSGYQSAMGIDADGYTYLAGNTIDSARFAGVNYPMNAGLRGGYLAKIDPSGNVVWVKELPGANNGFPEIRSIDFGPNGNIYVAGSVTGGIGAFDNVNLSVGRGAFIICLDTAGTGLWLKKFSTSSATVGAGFNDIKIDQSNGDIFFAGWYVSGVMYNLVFSPSNNPSTIRHMVAGRLDSLANYKWVITDTTVNVGITEFTSIEILGNDKILTGGYFNTPVSWHGWSFTTFGEVQCLAKITGSTNTINGTVYYDSNGNAQQDPGENGIPNRFVMLSPNRSFHTSDSGRYEMLVDSGQHLLVGPAPPLYHTATPATRTVNANGYNLNIVGEDFAIAPIPGIQDLSIQGIAGGTYRPGIPIRYFVNCTNLGTTSSNPVVQVVLDSQVSADSIVPAPSAVSGNTLSWNLPLLAPGASHQISMRLTTDTTAQQYDNIEHTLTVNPVTGDTTPADNVYISYDVVLSSFDPNDKQVSPDRPLHPSEVAAERPLYYRIRFQNTGTAPAYTVRLLDTLSPFLNPATFQIVSASHPYDFFGNPDGNLEWLFAGIELPDSGSDQAGSQGYVEYRISPYPGMQIGDTAFNSAGIYFDYNAPVQTNEVATPVMLSQAQVIVVDEPACAGDSSGVLAISGTGFPPFSFGLDSTSMSLQDTLGGLSAGPYVLYLRDDFGDLIATDTIWIAEPPVLTASVVNTPATSGNNGSLDVTASGGTPPYQYGLNGGSFQPSGLFSNLAAGAYTILVLDANGCEFQILDTVSTASALEPGRNPGITVYPVPATTIVYVQLPDLPPLDGQLRVLDLSGKVIHVLPLSSSGSSPIQLDVQGWPAGNYLLELNRPDGSFKARVVVVPAK